MTKISKLGRLAKTLMAPPLAIGLLAAVAAPAPAHAIGFQNCSGVDLRIHVYNNNDVVMAIGEKGGLIEAGKLQIWKVSKRKKAAKVFQANYGGLDKLIFTQSNLNHDWDYRVQVSGDGTWKVVPAGHPVPPCP